jgi:DNA-binding protein H-NS
MKINLSTMCMEDLQQLQLALLQEIENRHTQERALVMEELAALARARGFKLDELWRTMKPASKATSVSKSSRVSGKRARVKYRHPEKPDLAWSGRGWKPHWVTDWLAGGRTIEELVV